VCLDFFQTQKDVWIVYELGGVTLSKTIYDIKGEFYKNERVYRIIFTQIYPRLFQKAAFYLQSLIKGIAKALILFQEKNLIHCDIKPENILVQIDGQSFTEVKIIDFGSCYNYHARGNIQMITSEYMPPEVIELLSGSKKYQNRKEKTQLEILNKITNSWSIDVWSLGAVLIEILSGIPHWLNYKCLVVREAKNLLKTGLFAVKG